MADDRPEATTHGDQYHRHEPDPSKWEEKEAVTGRPNDTPLRGEDKPAVPNSTLAERAKARTKQVEKDQEQVENKAVTSAAKKAPAKKAAAKK